MRSPLFALIRKDLKGYFDQPIGYMLVLVFVALLSWSFFNTVFLTEEASLRALFTVDFTFDRPSLPWLLVLFVPAATMRLIAEEQRDGTLEILLTQPIRGWIVLLAKFLAGLMFVGVFILATIGIPIALQTAGNIDWGAVAAQYIGSVFLAASLVAIGLFTSSVTRNQIVAFILGFTISAVLMVVGMDRVAVALPPRLAGLLQTLSPVTHFSTVARGVIDLRDFLYFVALVSAFLSATFLMIRSKTLSHVSPQFRNLQLGVAGLIVLSLLVGWFGNSIGGRLDLTEDKIFTLASATEDILGGLEDILTVELFESRDPPTQVKLVSRDVNDFLEDFAASSGGKVKLIHRYPDPNGEGKDLEAYRKAEFVGVPPVQFNIQSQGELQIKVGYLGMALTYLDRREVVPFVSSIDGFEYTLASLAFDMVQQDRKTVAFLAGHGEKSVEQDLPRLASLLSQQYDIIEVRPSEDELPDPTLIDVLVIPGPTERFSDELENWLASYLNGGGKAMILIDRLLVDQRLFAVPNRNSLAEFVERYGVIVEDNLVFDLQSNEQISLSTAGGSVVVSYPYWMRVPIVDQKIAGDVETVILPWASEVAYDIDSPFEHTELLRTRPSAAIDRNYGDVGPNAAIFDQITAQNLVESLMGVAVTGRAAERADGSGQASFRIVVMGDSDWLTLADRFPENLGLGLNLIDWLAEEDALASIRSKLVSTRQLTFDSSTHRNLVQYANIVGVPLGFVLIGLIRFARRRNVGMREYRPRER